MSNLSRLQAVSSSLDTAIQKVNNLPDAGGSGSGENVMIDVTLSGLYDMYYLDIDGNLQSGHDGTISVYGGLIIYNGVTYTLKGSGDFIYSRIGSFQSLKFNSSGGSARLTADNSGGSDN